jgi:hypothetical protein
MFSRIVSRSICTTRAALRSTIHTSRALSNNTARTRTRTKRGAFVALALGQLAFALLWLPALADAPSSSPGDDAAAAEEETQQKDEATSDSGSADDDEDAETPVRDWRSEPRRSQARDMHPTKPGLTVIVGDAVDDVLLQTGVTDAGERKDVMLKCYTQWCQ